MSGDFVLIKIEALHKSLYGGGHEVRIISNLDFHVPAGQFVAITGASGSGKSTLLGLIAGLDTPTNGRIFLDGEDLTQMNEDSLAILRGKKIGIVFQNFHLIPTLTAIENVSIPYELSGGNHSESKAKELLKSVGLDHRLNHYPGELSGGEQQRLAVARAFINGPKLLLADEPTGNLDSANSHTIIDLLEKLHKQHGVTLVLVTHEKDIAAKAERVIELEDGRIVSDSAP